jgi:hypothetical protein
MGDEYKPYPYNFLTKEAFTQPSCAVGLFFIDKSVIKNKCEPSLKQVQIFYLLARVFSFNNGSFLIAHPDKTWTKICEGFFYLNSSKPVLYCECALKFRHFIILPHLHLCFEHTDVIMAHKLHLPLHLHSESLILHKLQFIFSQFENSVACDKPRE